MNLRHRTHEIIFEADTRAGKMFDVMLIICILVSVLAVMLDSIVPIRARYGDVLSVLEWIFTILFTVEYILRLASVKRPLAYATSFFGIVDLLAVIPTYLGLLVPGTEFLLVIRILRVLRVFRVLKLVQYVSEANVLLHALRASGRKITVFLVVVITLVIISGSLIYVIEGAEHGFTSIPKSIYWAIVTMTTVGYGDLAPETPVGQTIAAIIMIIGFSIIAVPTGIVAAELGRVETSVSTQACPSCSREGHEVDAKFCKHCGESL